MMKHEVILLNLFSNKAGKLWSHVIVSAVSMSSGYFHARPFGARFALRRHGF